MAEEWPAWVYHPLNVRPPQWVPDFLKVVERCNDEIATVASTPAAATSDRVLALLAPGLADLGYAVEAGKSSASKIRRPVLFGENGRPSVVYEVDAFHDDCGIVVEVEAGRGARGNAAFRDLIRSSLILDARYLALLLPIAYRYATTTVLAYRDAREQLAAIYASQRLRLPFDGVLLVGY